MYYSVYVDGSLLFSTNSMNSTPYVTEAKLSLSDNSAGSLDFTTLPGCPVSIQRMKSYIRVVRDGSDIWSGRVLTEERNFTNMTTYHCEGALTYLLDSVQPERSFSGTVGAFLADLLSVHNARVDSQKQMTLGSVTVNGNVEIDISYETTLDLITSVLVNSEDSSLQGHLRVRTSGNSHYLDYLSDYPRTSSQTIRFAENLLDFTQNFDLSDLATVIIPIGTKKYEETEDEDILEDLEQDSETDESGDAETEEEEESSNITIAEVNNGSIYLESASLISLYGRIEKTVEFGEVADAAELLEKSRNWFSEKQFGEVAIQVNVLDLRYTNSNITAFDILDKVQCVSTPHGLNATFPITEMDINLLDPADTIITLNKSESMGISAASVRTGEKVDARLRDLPDAWSIYEMGKRNATEIMNRAMTGYVTIVKAKDGHAEAIVISEEKDWKKSKHLWKWAMNGFAYSDDGGETWGLAMTMDGSIVANFITAGVMSADRIQGGTLKLGGIFDGVVNYNGILEVYNENDELIGKFDTGNFTLHRGNKKIGYLNGNVDVIGTDGNVNPGVQLAGLGGLILRSPILGTSKAFEIDLDDETTYYHAGGDGLLNVVDADTLAIVDGTLQFETKALRFTNGLMTSALDNAEFVPDLDLELTLFGEFEDTYINNIGIIDSTDLYITSGKYNTFYADVTLLQQIQFEPELPDKFRIKVKAPEKVDILNTHYTADGISMMFPHFISHGNVSSIVQSTGTISYRGRYYDTPFDFYGLGYSYNNNQNIIISNTQSLLYNSDHNDITNVYLTGLNISSMTVNGRGYANFSVNLDSSVPLCELTLRSKTKT